MKHNDGRKTAFGGKANRGSALLVVLCAVALIAAAVMGVLALVKKSQQETVAMNQMLQVRQIAENGLTIGMHPQIRENDPLLHGASKEKGAYDVELLSEGARLNINFLLQTEEGANILRQLFRQWGISDADTSAAVSSLQDWVDADDFARADGAESDYYQKNGRGDDIPGNKPFQTVEEMAMVRGMDAVAAIKPDWAQYFTLWSEGKLDLNDAPADLIEAVCHTSPAQTLALIQVRQGMKKNPDPKLQRWTDISQPLALLGISSTQGLDQWVTVSSNVWRVQSTGKMGKRQCILSAVVQRSAQRQSVLYYHER